MTVPGTPASTVDPLAVDRTRRARGLLRIFNDAGVLAAADVHVASRLSRLGGEEDERVLLAVALTVRAVRTGSVCLELAAAAASVTGDEDAVIDLDALPWPEPAAWERACLASPLVAAGGAGAPGRPLRLVQGLLYLDRYWEQEREVREDFDARAARTVPGVDTDALRSALQRLFPADPPDRQRLAAASIALRPLTVLAGGPGTGKTTTVARLLALLAALPGPPLRVALAAPTGKAAARLQEAVREESARLPPQDQARWADVTASTVHRLLGWRPGSASRFAHDRAHRLPYDVVVIDETSMVSLTLMSRLFEALRPDTRLVLVGDPDQLASVEAGAVLGDLVARPSTGAQAPPELLAVAAADLPTDPDDVAALRNGVVRLEKVHRFGTAIEGLARQIRAGAADEVLTMLRAGDPAVEFVETDVGADRRPAGIDGLRDDVVAAGTALAAAAEAGDVAAALDLLGRHRLLCAHRRGPYGVARWALEVERWLGTAGVGAVESGPWYPGRPLLVTSNDNELRLYNGDTGVVVADARAAHGAVLAAFGRAEQPVLLPTGRLGEVQTVHAMTVHRGQGSQFARVTLILPPPDSPLLTRELLYTAVTRATEHVRVLGTAEAVRAAVGRRVRRASGLQRVVS